MSETTQAEEVKEPKGAPELRYQSKTDAGIEVLRLMNTIQQAGAPGLHVRHWKGDPYRLLCLSTDALLGTGQVVYENEKGEVFNREVNNFLDVVEEDGGYYARYKLIC